MQMASEGGKKLKCGYYVNKRRDLGIFLKDLGLQKAEGKFMERVVLTLAAVPPPAQGGTGTAPGCSGSFGDPRALG